MGGGPRISATTAQTGHRQRASPGGDDACAANESPAMAAQLVHPFLPVAMAARDCFLSIQLLLGSALAGAKQPSWHIYHRRSRLASSCMVSAPSHARNHQLVSRPSSTSAQNRRSAGAYTNPDSMGQTGQVPAFRHGTGESAVL